MKSVTILIVFAFALLTAAAAASTDTGSAERMLTMPALDLARECNAAEVQRMFLKLARSGSVVVINGKKVNKRNVDKVTKEIDAQLVACNLAAERRDVAQLSGEWHAQVTGCDRSASLFADTAGGEGAVVTIAQSAGSVLLTISGNLNGKPFSFEAPGRVIENVVVLTDPGNSEYPLIGHVVGTRVTIRPDTDRVLATWPEWAGPPQRTDLESCLVTLEPVVIAENQTAP